MGEADKDNGIGHSRAIAANIMAHPWLASVPVRAAIISIKLMLVYLLSQDDARFFYQQF